MGRMEPRTTDDVLRHVWPDDIERLVALYEEALAAEDLVRRLLTDLGIGPEAVTVATLDDEDRPVVYLRLTTTAARQLAQQSRDGGPAPPPHSDAA